MLTRNGKPLNVLIVEDQTLIALDLALTIEELGAAVVGQVRSGERGVELARALLPDLVIMDVRLAGAIDGIDAAQTIARLPGVALVFVTGNNDPATMARIRSAGDFIVVPKPIVAAALEDAVHDACAIDKPARACAATVWQISALPRRAPGETPHAPPLAELTAHIVAASRAAQTRSCALVTRLEAEIEALTMIRADIAQRRAARARRRHACDGRPSWTMRCAKADGTVRPSHASPLGAQWL